MIFPDQAFHGQEIIAKVIKRLSICFRRDSCFLDSLVIYSIDAFMDGIKCSSFRHLFW